jgi:hypothetical protein
VAELSPSNEPGNKDAGQGHDVVGFVGPLIVITPRPGSPTTRLWNADTNQSTEIVGRAVAVNQATGRAVFDVSGDGQCCQELRELGHLSPADRGSVLWRLCGPIGFHHFSADGSHLRGTGYSDGMPGEVINGPDGQPMYAVAVVVRAEDAEVVAELDRASVFGEDVRMMEKAGGITAQVNVGPGRRSLVRCQLNGDCNVVGEARLTFQPDIPESEGPYVLSEN